VKRGIASALIRLRRESERGAPPLSLRALRSSPIFQFLTGISIRGLWVFILRDTQYPLIYLCVFAFFEDFGVSTQRRKRSWKESCSAGVNYENPKQI